jgi:dGTPase
MADQHPPALHRNRLDQLNRLEELRLAAAATPSASAQRRREEKRPVYRQQFALDADRILHSRAYIRYIDKTQVFSLVANDHITHRVLHVQMVARIARTIGRFLFLNEDLIEAIALGHDIGHPPFGHVGEEFLAELCREHGLPPFQHNIQSVRFLDQLERKGRGWNLTLEVLDGILCHDGEVHDRQLFPAPPTDFVGFARKLAAKAVEPQVPLSPTTLEGCVVRLADTVAYIGRDIEDAIILGLIHRGEIPKGCQETLGTSNGTIVYRLVTDLIHHSRSDSREEAVIAFSPEMAEALAELKRFNYQRIYLAPRTKEKDPLIRECYRRLFAYFLDCLEGSPRTLPHEIDLMTDIDPLFLPEYSSPERVRDFIAGMTDDYFIRQARKIGCPVPDKR